MECQQYNLKINQGSDLRFAIRVKGSDGLPEDVTGREFKGQIRASYEDEDALASFAFTLRDQTVPETKGFVDVHLPNTALAQADLKLSTKANFKYDIEMKYAAPSTDKVRIMEGDAIVYPEATHS